MRAFSCFVAVCVATLGANAESTLKSSASTPVATSEIPNLQEDEAAFRQAVGSSLGSLGFSTGGGSASAQGFQSAASSGSYQPPYNALNSVYGITYHGDYNQLANYLQPGGGGGALKPNQKPTISSRFRNFMNSLFFRRSNKHPPAFVQPPSGNFGGSGYASSPPFSGFGSSAVGGVVPSSFGAFPSSGQGQYDFSTLVGTSGTGGSKGSFGPFASSSGLGGLSSVSTATAFGPSATGTSSFGSSGTGSSFGSSGAGSSFGSSGAGPSYGSSPTSFGSSSGYSGSSPSFSSSQAGSGFSRFGGSSSSGSTGSGGTTYFPGETGQHHPSIGSSSVYQSSAGAFGKGIEDSKSDEDKDGKDDQE